MIPTKDALVGVTAIVSTFGHVSLVYILLLYQFKPLFMLTSAIAIEVNKSHSQKRVTALNRGTEPTAGNRIGR